MIWPNISDNTPIFEVISVFSILAFNKRNTKFGLAVDELYADQAVLIPELLEALPFRFFATSSVDALIHAVESSLSPKATPYTKLFGYKAIDIILNGYKKIAAEGEDARLELLDDFLMASNYAGIAFGTAGCGPVHGMSYPLSGTFHVAHGEANYALFAGVMNYYSKTTGGALTELLAYIGEILGSNENHVLEDLEQLLDQILTKKSLGEYGATPEMLKVWTTSVIETQQRLMANSFVPLNNDQVLEIYNSIY